MRPKMTFPDFSSTRLDTTNPAVVRRALMEYLPTDVSLNNMLQSDVGNWSFIYDAAIVGSDGKALLHTNANLVGKTVVARPPFQRVLAAHFREQLRLVYSPATVYDVSFPLQLNGAPFGTIRIGVSTVFLKSELTPRLMHALTSRSPLSSRLWFLPPESPISRSVLSAKSAGIWTA